MVGICSNFFQFSIRFENNSNREYLLLSNTSISILNFLSANQGIVNLHTDLYKINKCIALSYKSKTVLPYACAWCAFKTNRKLKKIDNMSKFLISCQQLFSKIFTRKEEKLLDKIVFRT